MTRTRAGMLIAVALAVTTIAGMLGAMPMLARHDVEVYYREQGGLPSGCDTFAISPGRPQRRLVVVSMGWTFHEGLPSRLYFITSEAEGEPGQCLGSYAWQVVPFRKVAPVFDVRPGYPRD